MTFSPSKRSAPNTLEVKGRENTAEILSHPHRLSSLMAKKRASEERLAIQKSTAIEKVKGAIAEAEAINADCNTPEASWVIAELHLILKEITPIQPAVLPSPDSLSILANRLHRAMIALMYCNSSAQLNRTCRRLIAEDLDCGTHS